ncbi:MAG: 1,2-phenylacetyl-CoA epoxidase subunit PaaC [Betaproteobacteria bacterium]
MAPHDPLVDYLLRLGDNCLILGHRLSEWVGHGPAIEEELAVGNVALDLLGQARMWLSLAGQIEGRGRDEDKLAYLRDAGEYRNLLLLEQPNGDFAMTIARQYFFDAFHHLLLRELAQSTDARIADIAAKSLKEVDYHLRRSGDWVVRLGDGTDESHRRMQAGIDDLWFYTGEMFERDAVDDAMCEQGAGVDPSTLQAAWSQHVSATLGEATLEMPKSTWTQRGGKRGVHTEHLGYLLAEMQFLQRAYPDSTW